MTSDAKISANRNNALRSTGPTSARGKALSRSNAVTHGIYAALDLLPGEYLEAYEALSTEHFDWYRPFGPEEVFQVQRIVHAKWRIMRVDKGEYALLRRTETDIMLAEHLDVVNAPQGQVDCATRERLARETRQATGEQAPSQTENDQLFEFEKDGAPPVADVFRQCYAGALTYAGALRLLPIDKLDQQQRALQRLLSSLREELRTMQRDRISRTDIPTGDESPTTTP